MSFQRSLHFLIMDDEGLKLGQIHFKFGSSLAYSPSTAGMVTVTYVENLRLSMRLSKFGIGVLQNKAFLFALVKYGHLPAPSNLSYLSVQGSHLFIKAVLRLIKIETNAASI